MKNYKTIAYEFFEAKHCVSDERIAILDFVEHLNSLEKQRQEEYNRPLWLDKPQIEKCLHPDSYTVTTAVIKCPKCGILPPFNSPQPQKEIEELPLEVIDEKAMTDTSGFGMGAMFEIGKIKDNKVKSKINELVKAFNLLIKR